MLQERPGERGALKLPDVSRMRVSDVDRNLDPLGTPLLEPATLTVGYPDRVRSRFMWFW